jgi:hypothetical protein
VSCPASVTYSGTALTPCTATATGAGGLNQSLTVTYTSNTNAGTATASASFDGDANHTGSTGSTTFQIQFLFTGFLSPLAPAGTSSGIASQGSSLPMKWTLQTASLTYISDLTTLSSVDSKFQLLPANGVCPVGLGTYSVPLANLYSPAAGFKGGSNFRFPGPNFQLNLDTSYSVLTTTAGVPTGPGCYVFLVTLSDLTTKELYIQLK